MKSSTEASKREDSLTRYGDLVYDLCHSVLKDLDSSQTAFREIALHLRKAAKKTRYSTYERAWILHQAATKLIAFERHRPRVIDPVQAYEETGASHESEQTRFKYFFGRLAPEDRILLVLSDKFDLPIDEIATILETPADSLKLSKALALTRLAEQVLPQDPQKSPSPTAVQSSLISTKLAHQPRVFLPDEAKKDPLTKNWHPRKSGNATLSRLARWRKSPWYIRTGVESIAMALTILVLILSVPRLRTLYDKNLDRRLEAYNLAELAPEPGPHPFMGAKLPAQQSNFGPNIAEGESGDDSSGEELQESKEDPLSPVRIHEGEIWRFYIKTESPLEVRPKIAQVLQTLSIHEDNPGFRGLEAPGGIQFDLVVSKETVIKLRQEIDALAKNVLSETGNESLTLGQIFTWYRSRSKKPIPTGKTRVVIWLSQI